MPAAANITPAERAHRAKKLAQAIADTGLPRRTVAARLAESRGVLPTTMEANLKRWTGKPRPGAIDAAPDWIIGEVEAIKVDPSTVVKALDASIAAGFISVGLARRARAVIARR